MAIDKEAIKEHVRGILIALGDDPDREGLIETPDRVARMYEEVFEGMNYTNDELAEMFGKTFAEDGVARQAGDMVFVKDIEVFSYCEHHMALMYDMKVSVAYIPNGRVLGLSKIARIADMVAKRLQLQERIGSDIAYVISKAAGTEDVAVMILDVMMPKMDGWETLKEIRKFSQVPVIMLTAKADERDELQGFNLGVDEYITKPFSPKILVARVAAILRRTSDAASEERLSAGGIDMDLSAHIVTIDGKPVELSFKEFELLQYFIVNRGVALSREKILNNVWNYDYYGDARTIDTHVKKLRSKMGAKGDYIKTIWGVGYRFEVE